MSAYRTIGHLVLDDVSCIRCMTTYYCEGDGEQKMCGRCDNDTTPCDRDPTEHSFGNSSECSPCPEGWVRYYVHTEQHSNNFPPIKSGFGSAWCLIDRDFVLIQEVLALYQVVLLSKT